MLPASVPFLLAVLAGVGSVPPTGRDYWVSSAHEDLEASLQIKWNTGIAKNVIIFIGDGMGPTTITAGRIYNGGEESYLSWEKFPHVGALKTYAEDKMVTDSGASATSMFTGVKVNYNVIGLNSVKLGDCSVAPPQEAKLTHITTLAQAAGKSTGIVTSARLTHATPSAMYAHSPDRYWECYVPDNATACKDIGRQMVEDLPARDINVLLGAGEYQLKYNVTPEYDPIDKYCNRTDGRDLIDEWAKEKAARNLKYAVVRNTGSMLSVDTENTDYLLGVFAKNHMKFHHERDTSAAGEPTLAQMTKTALKILKKNKNGFLLMVENEHIDLAHHLGKARIALNEVVELHKAINDTMSFLEAAGIKDETLVIVTSDHSHTLTISGYPVRGNNILGLTETISTDGKPFTTLSYANGPNGYHYKAINGTVVRDDPSKVDTTSWDYSQQVAVLQDRNTHGGHDVLVYASGPFAHLFHHMHDQNYLNYVVKYAAKLGEYSDAKETSNPSSSSANVISLSTCLFSVVSVLKFYFHQ